VLSVPAENDLIRVVERINRHGIQASVFFEPDNNLGYTAACTEPLGSGSRKLFRKYPLWQP
jgi:hypothetical protein